MSVIYDKIGINCAELRKPDWRIAQYLKAPLDLDMDERRLRYAELLTRDAYDARYRLVVAD